MATKRLSLLLVALLTCASQPALTQGGGGGGAGSGAGGGAAAGGGASSGAASLGDRRPRGWSAGAPGAIRPTRVDQPASRALKNVS